MSTLKRKFEIFFTEPKLIALIMMNMTSCLWSDKTYLRTKFKLILGKKLNLENPQTFNEKLQWLKLYDRKPEYTIMVDKVKAKEYVAGIIGEEYIIPTLNVWKRPEDIEFNALPNQFVLKCNHNSGLGMYICKDKSKITQNEWKKVVKGLRRGLRENYFLHGREWPYKNVPRRILCEKFMEDKSQNGNINDYKIFCFDGEMKALFIATDRYDENGKEENVKFDFFDRDFNHLPFTNGHPNAKPPYKKPECFEEMIQIAEKLSKGIPQARIDLYVINGKIYFGEITFSHWSGMKAFEPEEWDYTFGSWIKLPKLTL